MNVLVKVVGFSADERHAVQTLLRLSQDSDVRYRLWCTGDTLAPNVLLLDADSHEAALEMQSPTFPAHTKSMVVGDAVSIADAWRVFRRPLEWAQIARELDALFVSAQPDIPIHAPDEIPPSEELPIPPGYKTGLIIGLPREQQLYLKARLSLQGIAHVVEVANAGEATEYLGKQGFDVVIVSQCLPDADTPALVLALRRSDVCPPRDIIAVLSPDGWESRQQLEDSGVTGVLDLPFTPQQVSGLFARL